VPETFLALLNSRGCNLPDVFAFPDSISIYLAHGPLATRKHSILLEQQKDQSTYGRIMTVKAATEMATGASGWFCYEPSLGLHVMEAQLRVQKFLAKCVNSVLGDKDLTSLGVFPMTASPPNLEVETTLASWLRRARHESPDKFDTQRVLHYFQLTRLEACDHIHSLKEDPGYFNDVLREQRDHWATNIAGHDLHYRDTGSSSTRTTFNMPYSVPMAIRKIALEGYARVCVFGWFTVVLGELDTELDKLLSGYSLSRRLPRQAEKWLQILAMVLHSLIGAAQQTLQMIVHP